MSKLLTCLFATTLILARNQGQKSNDSLNQSMVIFQKQTLLGR